ncbi:hypothetical protein EI545_01110 [Tabrizicola piscis]|uniref:DUF7379 domain-containing protein n=1 Tax=Tabrizicola piscis TaxID=2494374 RepID=A0A3S8U1T4_9RHOB|nr:hypothetical protein [Tabrizicola piscis]AZL57564.1 hypothetical protein EI545_01110 [Tabrizicola piscis]
MRLRLKLNLSFKEFDDAYQARFLGDFSTAFGLQSGDIRTPTFRPGCVIFEADFDTETAKKILAILSEAVKVHKAGDLKPEIQVFLDLVDQYSIEKSEKAVTRLTVSMPREARPTDRYILFVHGWNGAASSFGKLPKFLEEETNLKSAVYEFPTSALQHSPAVHFVSENLDNWIRNHFTLQNTKFAIIAHSMGGIVVRKFITSQMIKSKPIDSAIKQVTFVASPHTGTALATATKLIPGLSSEQLRELSPTSAELVQLNSSWDFWKSKNLGVEGHIRSIYGTADMVVPVSSATVDDPNAIPILGATHTDIVKPISRDSEIVITLKRLLSDAGLIAESRT